MEISRRVMLGGLAAGVAGAAAGVAGWQAQGRRLPNIVMIVTDDQGFSDLSCTWQPNPDFPRIDTPRLDSIAAQGVQFDLFYVAASVCTPSRAALMTGCYPPRVGFGAKARGPGVITPDDRTGLNPAEVTLPELLQRVGYATGCVGKWHLGHRKPFLPTAQGFDGFYGIPYSNNQRPLPLMRDEEVVRNLVDNPLLTGPFTQAAISFMTSATQPFFLYLAHSAPHWPWNVAPARRGDHARGIYGDVIAELDWSVGEVLDALEQLGVAEDTLVLFFSDNGPYIDARTGIGGTNHPLRGGKGDTWEGGVRTPFLARWPGVIRPGTRCGELVTAMDLLPTLAAIAGTGLPSAPIDGRDIGALLRGEPGAVSPHAGFHYYARGRLEAVRGARFKRVYANDVRRPAVRDALYDLQEDPAEQVDVRAKHPEVVQRLDAEAERMRVALGDGLRGIQGRSCRPIGSVPG